MYLPWTNTHQEWRHANNGRSDVFAKDLLTEPFSRTPLHEQNCRCTIGNLRGIAGVDRAVLVKRRLDLAQALEGGLPNAMSFETVISLTFSVFGSSNLTLIGAISSSNKPCFCAASAFL